MSGLRTHSDFAGPKPEVAVEELRKLALITQMAHLGNMLERVVRGKQQAARIVEPHKSQILDRGPPAQSLELPSEGKFAHPRPEGQSIEIEVLAKVFPHAVPQICQPRRLSKLRQMLYLQEDGLEQAEGKLRCGLISERLVQPRHQLPNAPPLVLNPRGKIHRRSSGHAQILGRQGVPGIGDLLVDSTGMIKQNISWPGGKRLVLDLKVQPSLHDHDDLMKWMQVRGHVPTVLWGNFSHMQQGGDFQHEQYLT